MSELSKVEEVHNELIEEFRVNLQKKLDENFLMVASRFQIILDVVSDFIHQGVLQNNFNQHVDHNKDGKLYAPTTDGKHFRLISPTVIQLYQKNLLEKYGINIQNVGAHYNMFYNDNTSQLEIYDTTSDRSFKYSALTGEEFVPPPPSSPVGPTIPQMSSPMEPTSSPLAGTGPILTL